MNPALSTTALHCSDIALDLGTAWTRLAAGPHPVRQRRSASAGRRALAGGVLVNSDAAVEMLQPLLRQARRGLTHPRLRVVACAPTDASAEEKAVLTECLLRAGASAAYLAPEPLAAAVGSAVDVAAPYAKMLVDLGEGVTDCAIIRSAQIVASSAVRTGCADLREAIRAHALSRLQLEISATEAERLLRALGVAGTSSGVLAVSGLRAHESCTLRVPRSELQDALAPIKAAILGSITGFLRRLPDSLAVEIIEDGISLTGGGALLKGMREELAHAAHVEVRVVNEPLTAVIRGARAMLPVAAALGVWPG